ncbi:MAG: NADH-quinone oxidoreductase subunit L [Dehalococcoidia bacterium]
MTVYELVGWAIVLLPLFATLVNLLVVAPVYGPRSRLASIVVGAAVGSSFIGALLMCWYVIKSLPMDGPLPMPLYNLVSIGKLQLQFGLLIDGLTAIMLVVVSGVSLLVQIYSHGYMKTDTGYLRYYCFMGLFTSAMLLLVSVNSLILVYASWEIVGLCSYLLIGFWFHRPAAAAAAKKAFIITRIGDLFFLISIVGIFAIFSQQGVVSFVLYDFSGELDILSNAPPISSDVLAWVALGIFAGAAGKSAQFPFHTWLPDAMEGPTPVSALIHAATMVVAGVFLIARFMPMIGLSEIASTFIVIIGCFTVVFAASMALVMTDIKRVLAYSTISQLGYMFVALGFGAIGPAIFHLFNHAFFKALLFLGAGSLNHATGTFEMKNMISVRKSMPWTHLFFLVGSISLAGLPPFSGFWSKDEIISSAIYSESVVAFPVSVFLLLGAFLTSLYIFRAYFLTFTDKKHLMLDEIDDNREEKLLAKHESPLSMVAPMAILTVLACFSWVVNSPWFHVFADVLGSLGAEHESIHLEVAVLGFSSSLLGLLVALSLYWFNGDKFIRRLNFGPLHKLVKQKYYIDYLFENIIVSRLFYSKFAKFLESKFDSGVIDSSVNLVGFLGRNIGRPLSRLQSGNIQFYMAVFSTGMIIIFAIYFIELGV